MNKRQIKKWVCGLSASLLLAELSAGRFERIAEDEGIPNSKRIDRAARELIRELGRRSSNEQGFRNPKPT